MTLCFLGIEIWYYKGNKLHILSSGGKYMKFNAKDIVKFLFPEWQVIDAYRKKGFIAKKSNDKIPDLNASPISEKIGNISKDTSVEGSTVLYNQEKGKKADNSDMSIAFDNIRTEIGKEIIGQTNYLDNLCLAFKRPFAIGFDKERPKNVMILSGDKGTGKHYSISLMAKLLKEKQLTSSDAALAIDLSLYPTLSEFGLFLSDLYKCLYGQSDVVVFDNFDKCHQNMRDVIKTLTTTGKYTLGARYLFQNGTLVEATGMLLKNLVSEVSSNGKYFVFISEKDEKDFKEIMGLKFIDSVGDIIYTDSFTREDLIKLALKIMEDIKKKCKENLSLELNFDNSVIEYIASKYKSSTGVGGMDDFATVNIYKPLAEYKLKNSVITNQKVGLSVINNGIKVQFGKERIDLSELIPRKRSAEIEEVKKELDSIIGIESVKQYVLSLEDNQRVQKARENAGYKMADISMHMIFTGNPGTGKTTIARIVAKYLKALGILSTGQLREVSRAELVGQYVGHTAKLTNDVIKSALGGVLFIDEAYALCRDKHDTFGIEAIDTLVKGMEDNRDDLVVILAGYNNEMNEFLKVNPGLKSRFPNIINFEDYTAEEMYRISLLTAKSKGYKIAEDCKDALIDLFERKQVKGRNDSGNGRLVRNVVESAILNQSKRLILDNSKEMDLLKYEDFGFNDNGNFDLEATLAQIIGLDNVKEFVRTQYKLLIAQEKRKKAGMKVDTTQSLNMIFSGNPGTGKTTVARVVAAMFKDMGLLKSGHLVETDSGGLIAEYVGHTAKKTEEVFRRALGGVLFIDEAYALSDNGASYGKEAIDTLVKLIEDYRGEMVVILAGYKKDMDEFLKTNSGLDSRFPLRINFSDYSEEELFKISEKIIADKGFVLSEQSSTLLKEQVYLLKKQSSARSGNGRMVRNYVEEIMRKQSARIAMEDVPVDEMNLIIPEDIEVKIQSEMGFDLENELSKIIGLNSVKDYIRSLNARLRMQNERKKLGLAVDNTQTLHMIFKGNPGTGKTMIARTVAKVLYNIGVINTNKLVETDRSGLVAGFVGQTALKTKEKFMEALDGVLFIDEAYSLSQGGGNDFGKEAIDTLVKLMDDYRDRVVVILAGYSMDMEIFLSVNPGLRSRFPNITEFPDYEVEELMEISEMFFKDKGYELDSKAKVKIKEILSIARQEPHFGNGRYVRNLFEKAVNNQALRLSTDEDLSKEDLITITDEDIEGV